MHSAIILKFTYQVGKCFETERFAMFWLSNHGRAFCEICISVAKKLFLYNLGCITVKLTLAPKCRQGIGGRLNFFYFTNPIKICPCGLFD